MKPGPVDQPVIWCDCGRGTAKHVRRQAVGCAAPSSPVLDSVHKEILLCMAREDTIASTAHKLQISAANVRYRLQAMYRLFDVHSAAGAVAAGIRTGFIE